MKGDFCMSNEFEIIEHDKMNHLYAFLIEMKYRQPHLHTDIEIIYVIRGTLSVTSGVNKCLLHANELLVINSCQLHELHSEDKALLLIFQFNLQQFESAFPKINELHFTTEPLSLSDINSRQNLLEYIISACHSYFKEESNFPIKCHGLTSLIIYELLQHVPYELLSERTQGNLLAENERIRRISDYIQQNYQRKLLLQEIADIEGLTVSYLSHFFRNHFGLSFRKYLNMIRCEKAQYLLMHTSHNLLTISETCGFSDAKYLTRAFKTIYGMTPGNFRKINHPPVLWQYVTNEIDDNENQHIFAKDDSISLLKEHFPQFSR